MSGKKKVNGGSEKRLSKIKDSNKWLLTFDDYRYVYLFYNPKNQKTKIGITNNIKRRESGIEKSKSDFDIKLIFAIKLYNAKNIESKLHYDYHDDLSPDREGNGRTEWFSLNWFQRQKIKLYLLLVKVFQSVQYLLFLGFIFLTFFYFLAQYIN